MYLFLISGDFELAVLKSFQLCFVEVKIKGCLFHFSQSLFKKLTKCGLKDAYLQETDLQVWFRLFLL